MAPCLNTTTMPLMVSDATRGVGTIAFICERGWRRTLALPGLWHVPRLTAQSYKPRQDLPRLPPLTLFLKCATFEARQIASNAGRGWMDGRCVDECWTRLDGRTMGG
eukprot:365836-Chlamydomonas_euryale.AAC.7